MSSGTLTYPAVATPVNLSMALKVKMKQRKHPVQMMMQQRFLFVHQWTLMKLCQILQLMELPAPSHVCTPSVSAGSPHVCTPSKSFPGHTPSSSIPSAHSDETMSPAQILADVADGGVEPEPEEQVVFEDQTLEEVDTDILVAGVQRPAAIKFSLFCRKPAGTRLGVHVGKQKGLKRNSGLNFTGLSKVCGHDFEVKQIGGD